MFVDMLCKLAAKRLSRLVCCVYILCITITSASLSPAVQQSGRLLLSESDHKYELHDIIKLYANKVGPFSNPR